MKRCAHFKNQVFVIYKLDTYKIQHFPNTLDVQGYPNDTLLYVSTENPNVKLNCPKYLLLLLFQKGKSINLLNAKQCVSINYCSATIITSVLTLISTYRISISVTLTYAGGLLLTNHVRGGSFDK